jgi:hypothetical protein
MSHPHAKIWRSSLTITGPPPSSTELGTSSERRAAVVHNKLKNATDRYLAGLLNHDELAEALETAIGALDTLEPPADLELAALLRRLADNAALSGLDVRIDDAVKDVRGR